MVTHPASSLAQDRESSLVETSVLTTMLRRQLQPVLTFLSPVCHNPLNFPYLLSVSSYLLLAPPFTFSLCQCLTYCTCWFVYCTLVHWLIVARWCRIRMAIRCTLASLIWEWLRFRERNARASFIGKYCHVPLCCPFSRPFSRWTWVSRCLLKQRMMEVVVITGAINRAKLRSNLSPPTNQHPTFYRPDALPVTQPTVSKHWRENITFHGLAYPKLTWGSSNCIFDH